MRVAHFVQRYPPALGGSEAYFARLSRYLAARGHEVTVFTTTAVDLEAFWATRGRCVRAGERAEDGVTVRRYGLCRLPCQTLHRGLVDHDAGVRQTEPFALRTRGQENSAH